MLGLGCGRSNESSRRRGKKNGSEKRKQPQRGLGVAQLEKIILQNQMRGDLHKQDSGSRLQTGYPSSPPSTTSSSSMFDPCSSVMIGFGENAEIGTAYNTFNSSSFLNQGELPTLSLFERTTQIVSNNHDRSFCTRHNSRDVQEIDLELRL
ncbi:protein SPEAR1-like isoform X1 [Zingiber officinale]|uniref:protein SPEAR1-like isoform X1 n=1 Tax=Zingiber officinale TaxID=94328 RepID=UPI001C4CD265|nr:protein SPEAR1-like isoform X1 [Zingiber officinale]